ncbi:hypothetical protein [Amycolatopsis jejuensis]|uniref:hypothetical protein n=1 Tax=Amycolatopsis jejuensis TaxID=330084 RepID=UPI000524E47D|nr:hypothetical protein [Amycolatopsis jejuensis]
MQGWWLLAAGAAVFVVLALLFLRRAARARSSGEVAGQAASRRWVSPSDDLPRRARHRLDEAHPLARYPIARQRPMPHPREDSARRNPD